MEQNTCYNGKSTRVQAHSQDMNCRSPPWNPVLPADHLRAHPSNPTYPAESSLCWLVYCTRIVQLTWIISMHSSFVLAEIHWISGFKSLFLKAVPISPHFQISSVETTHQFRVSGNAARKWKTNTTAHFLCKRKGGIQLHLHHVSYMLSKYLLLCFPPIL